MSINKPSLVIIGGGAAGFFAAIQCAEACPQMDITILEQGLQVLGKVKISGGGRCNVTHACFDPKELIRFYPRGNKELLGPFHRFQPADMIEWLEYRGVELKTEADGRMFPITDNSATIVNCLYDSAVTAGVKIITGTKIKTFEKKENQWLTTDFQGNIHVSTFLLVAGGSSEILWNVIENTGHHIMEPVPSLFTFNIKSQWLKSLPGLSVPEAIVGIEGQKLQTTGPLLITHWGMSGPAILKLSAWGARLLAAMNYNFSIWVNWTGKSLENVRFDIEKMKYSGIKKNVYNTPLYNIPSRLWKELCALAELEESILWQDISHKNISKLSALLTRNTFDVKGKSTFKDEFVTCGGVALEEVNFKTMESKKQDNLYFAGEILDIDALTGGFNFQAAWTTAFIAGNAIAEKANQ